MIRRIGALVAAAAVLGVSSAGAAPLRKTPARKAPAAAARDWSRTVIATPEGGFRMGNPNARVKVLEYGSLTCPHCAAFSTSATGQIPARVRAGKVSFEFRNLILNGIDIAASLVARCGTPGQFFPIVDQVYATQPQWLGKFIGLDEARKEQMKNLPEGQRLVAIAETTGLLDLAARGGIPTPRSRACLVDPAGLDRLGKMAEAAAAVGVTSTPTFFVNGTKVPVHDWAMLDAELKKAGG